MVYRARVPSGLLLEIPRVREILPFMGPGAVPEPAEQEIGLSHLGIIVAVMAEARTLTKEPIPGGEVTALPGGAMLIVSGMGPTRAARTSRALLEKGATALLSWGSAGGLASKVS